MKPFFCLAFLVSLVVTAAGSAAEPNLVLDLGGGVKLEMVLLAKGTFSQGSPAGEQGRNDDEKQRQTTLTQDFYLGKFPVTVGQFARFVQETGYRTEAEKGRSGGFGFDGKTLVQRPGFHWRSPGFPQTDEHPVTIVSYDDAMAFTAWLAAKVHRKVTLPTEAQWEYACRAGTTTRFYAGDNEEELGEIAWYKANAGKGTKPVGQKRANRFGIHDMSGNVYQWCRDFYADYDAGPASDPERTRADGGGQPRRVLRGGSWMKEARHCRSAARFRNSPGSRNADNGFRVAASLVLIVESAASNPAAGPTQPANLGVAAPAKVSETPRPVAPQARVRPSPVHRSPGPMSWLLLVVACLLFGGFGVFVLVMILRQASRADRGGFSPPNGPLPPDRSRGTVVTPAVDGFWLELAGIAVGSTILCRYRVLGAEQETQVIAESGLRQFVYTGGQPSDIAVVRILSPGNDDLLLQMPIPPDIVTPSEPVSRQPPFTHFPSAY